MNHSHNAVGCYYSQSSSGLVWKLLNYCSSIIFTDRFTINVTVKWNIKYYSHYFIFFFKIQSSLLSVI